MAGSSSFPAGRTPSIACAWVLHAYGYILACGAAIGCHRTAQVIHTSLPEKIRSVLVQPPNQTAGNVLHGHSQINTQGAYREYACT